MTKYYVPVRKQYVGRPHVNKSADEIIREVQEIRNACDREYSKIYRQMEKPVFIPSRNDKINP